jgi:hypothetical protein
MNASKPKPVETTIAEPNLMDAISAMKDALQQDREMSVDEAKIVSRFMGQADRSAAAAVHQLGQELDRASQARAARSAYDAADRARERLNAFEATRGPAFALLPDWLRLQWYLLEIAGGRASAEGRALARLLEDVGRGEWGAAPSSWMPPKTPGQQ